MSAQPASLTEAAARREGAGEEGEEALDLEALRAELEDILDEGIAEALAQQRSLFEREYSRLLDSRGFWRRLAVGEGCAVAACLFGGLLVWGMR